MSVIYADTSFGVSPSASPAQNAINLNAAIAAAANAQTAVILPAGDIQFSSDLVLPQGFQGAVGVFGIGDKITRLVPVGGCNGINFDLSSGVAANNSALIKDLGLVASAGVAGNGLRLSYGTASLGSVENQPGSKVENVSIYGGGWTFGAIFQEAWHLRVQNLYVYGNSSTYTKASALGKGDGGAGSGTAIQLQGGVNNTFNGIVAEFFSQGIVLNNDGQAGHDCQGIFFTDIQMVETIEGLHAYGGVGGYLSTIELVDWMVDNGNINVPNHSSVIIENCIGGAFVSTGQGLQNGNGSANITFNNVKNGWIEHNSCEFRANVGNADILITGNSSGNEINGNTCAGNIEFDSGTSGNYYGTNPGASIINNGTGNTSMYQQTKLVNISTRGFVGTGGNIMIAGFVISGTNPIEVLIRATGPTLGTYGVAGALPDPKLQLLSGQTVIASNTVWGGSSQISTAAAQVGAFAWPTTSNDSAILVTLQPGAYTAEVSGASGDTGDALIEVYFVQ